MRLSTLGEFTLTQTAPLQFAAEDALALGVYSHPLIKMFKFFWQLIEADQSSFKVKKIHACVCDG